MNINQVIFEQFAYHCGPDDTEIKQYGLMSPYDLYKYHPNIFHTVVYKGYRDRTAAWLKRTKVSDEDILNYLDSDKRHPCTSKCLFFSFIPTSDMPYINCNGTEYKLDISTIKKYSINDPIIIESFNKHQISWSEFESIYNNLIQKSTKGAQRPPQGVLRYKYIIHFAVECNPIPYKELIKI